jgi:myo-inositol 2-dehydrogenase/D-chiro-inositol 1-dehydrogenase
MVSFFASSRLKPYAFNSAEEFVNAVSHDTPVPVDGKDGLMSVYIAIAADKTFRENRPVKLGEIV